MAYPYPLKFGKYIFVRRIAVGGMAEVFKAKLLGPKNFEKILAVKRILPEFNEDDDFIQMFVDEARISSNLHHSNIVQVFDFGEAAGSFYIAMELVDGPNLKTLFQRVIKEEGRFPTDLAVYAALSIAKALEYAHNIKIDGESSIHLVHRDVSPQNVLVSRSGEVKITDFGIAKATIKLSQTQPGKVQGKLSYMSPEQATGKPLDRRSDIFSLGIILYELLSGVKVYGGENTKERYEKIREARIPNLHTLAPGIPDELVQLVHRMVSKSPDDRPQTCQAVVDELTKILSHTSVAKLEQELAERVVALFPKEKSDVSVDPPLLPKKTEEEATQMPFTEVSLDRLKVDPSPIDDEPKTKPISIQHTEVDVRRPRSFPLQYVLLGVLVILVAAAVTHVVLRRAQDKDPLAQATPLAVATASPDDGTIASGPVDVDLRDAAKQREQEVESKLRALQEEVKIAKEDAERTQEELEKAQQKLAKITALESQGPCPSGMIHLKEGHFLLGSNPDDPDRNDLVESKLQSVSVPSFCMDRFEYPNKRGAVPRIRVSWSEAVDLCGKQGKRLCFQEEWERACKGQESETEDRKYMFGSRWRTGACNVQAVVDDQPKEQKILPSGTLKECTTKEGVVDLPGNVDEWTFSPGTFNSDSYVTKGGSSSRPIFQARCASIREVPRDHREKDLGFRCCKDAN